MEGFYLSFFFKYVDKSGGMFMYCSDVGAVKVWPDFVHGLYLLCIYFAYGMISALSYDWCF